MTRADELVDAAKAVIEAAAAVTPIPGTTITVSVEDDPEFDPDAVPAGQMRVFVGWASYADAGPATRGGDAVEVTLTVVVAEKCGLAGRVPTDWRRARSEWVQAAVVVPLGGSQARLGTAWAERVDEVSFDRDELAARKLFWSAVVITYRDEG